MYKYIQVATPQRQGNLTHCAGQNSTNGQMGGSELQ